MKKTLMILAVLALAVPAMAETVTITAEAIADGVVEIGYEVTGGAERVRAFALDITVSDGNISSVVEEFVGECNDSNQGYGIFLSNIVIDGSGNVTAYGSSVSDVAPALGGIDTNGVTCEWGSLYTGANEPNLTGVLCTITTSVADTNLCITVEDAARGGVVMEDPDLQPTVVVIAADTNCVSTLSGCACKGDVTSPGEVGVPEGRVTSSDFSVLLGILNGFGPSAGYSGPVPAGMECLDLTDPENPGVPDGLLSTSDMSVMLGHVNLYAGFDGPCIP